MSRRLFALCVFLPVVMGLLSTSPVRPDAVPPIFASPPNLLQLRADYNLTPAAEKLLLQNGSLVLDQVAYKTLGDAYPFQNHATPMFVTTDAMLEYWSSLNRELLKSSERDVCIPKLSALLPPLEQRAKALYEAAQNEQERSALRQVVVTIAVANRLLTASGDQAMIPPAIRAEVELQVQKVLAHREVEEYPGEDYTQYTVRSYYAADPALSRYFRASMWLSRRFFAVTPDRSGKDPDASLRAAIACAVAVRSAPAATRSGLIALIDLRQALAGPPDAISVPRLIAALDRSLGVGWQLNRALLPASLAMLRKELARPGYPTSQVRTRIVNELGAPYPDRTVALLPGIAVPDSVLFRHTVHPAIPSRSLPTGLEVAASLGSEVARHEIDQQEGSRSGAVLAAVDRYGAQMKQDDAGATVYSGWLHVLSTLSAVPAGAPAYMRSPAWQYEKLNTTLASWSQLRHNFVLYAEQNDAMSIGSQMETPALVEANPAFYHSMAELAGRMRKVLKASGASDLKSTKAIEAYEAKCREFEVYAQAELAGKLTQEQSVEIDKFCDSLDPSYTVSAAAEVADVATGMNGEVLHAATGDMHRLLVIPDPKTGVVYTGAVFSYYEFARKDSDRLTDARWQAQQAQTYLRPDRPAWSAAFLAREGGSEWETRAPLRAAEKLLVDNRTDDGLALLRATVEKNPDTTLATEAQLRLGRYYFDRKEIPQAVNQLRRCEHLPGCAAFDQAAELLRQIQSEKQRQDYLRSVVAPAQAKSLAELKRLEVSVAALRRSAQDAGQERHLTERLIAVLPWEERDSPHQAEVFKLLKSAATGMRTRPCQDAIGYALLIAERGGRYSSGSPPEIRCDLAYFRMATSPPLRAAALSLALEAGHLAGQPEQALALLKPFLDANFLTRNTDPAWKLIMTPPDPKSGSEQFSVSSFRTNPAVVFEGRVLQVLSALASAALDAGQIPQALRYVQLAPSGDSGMHNGEDLALASVLEQWGSIPKAELPAASLLAIQYGLEQKKRTGAMAEQALLLAHRYPHSRFALIALSRAIRSLTDAANTAQADRIKAVLSRQYPDRVEALALGSDAAFDRRDLDKIKAVLSRQYPNSVQALALAIEAAFGRHDLDRTRRLLATYKARDKETSVLGESDLDPVNVDWIKRRIENYDQLVQQMKPLLDAAHDPDMARMDRFESNGEPLAEALVLKLPDRAAEIYLTLSRIYRNPVLTQRFLERFPSHPQAAEAWKRLLGDDRSVTEGALNYGGPEVVEWLTPFVNRNDANSGAAAKLLKKIIAQGYEDAGIRMAEEESRIVQGRFPGSRAASVSYLAVAQVLLASRRPEAMLAYADRAIAGLKKEDPGHLEAEQLRQRATLEIAAKHRHDWSPLWEAALRTEDTRGFTEPPLPAVVSGLLLTPEPDAGGLRQLTALDSTTGARKWTSRLETPLIDFAVAQDGHGIFCVLENGEVAALDLKTGRKSWHTKVLSGQAGERVDGVLSAGQAVIVYGSKLDRRFERIEDDHVGIMGLSPQDGHPLWKHSDWHLPRVGRALLGKPAVFQDKIVVALDPAKVVAFQPDTGDTLWEHPYPAPPPDPAPPDPRAFRRAPRPSLILQPQAFEANDVMIFTYRPARRYDVLDGKTGALSRSIEPMRSLVSPTSAFAAQGYFIEWDANGGSRVSRSRDLSPLPTHVALRGLQESVPMAEHIVYFCDPQNSKLLAIDLETGATLGGAAAPAADFGSKVVLGEEKVFVVGFNGKVTGIPLFVR